MVKAVQVCCARAGRAALTNNANPSDCIQVSEIFLFILFATPNLQSASHARQSLPSTRGRAGCACWPGEVWWALMLVPRLYDGVSSPEFRHRHHIAPSPDRLQSTGQRPLPLSLRGTDATALCSRRQKGCRAEYTASISAVSVST